ncbi:hypothetical protein [Flavobacterium sp. 3HN19-14]|uniref:hypothetical protein n=1 Tax=Flavobacterium sp. 3HN19-14 TaxID=3448133 RepID=UPI003EE3DCD8
MQTLSLFLKSIWLYLAGIVAVLALYYLLIGIGQGMDVVIQSGEHSGKGIFMVICCILWAFLLWYSARTLSYIRQQKDYDSKKKSTITTNMHKHLPRLIGFNCFVCVQAGIVNLPSASTVDGVWVIDGWLLFAFIALHNFLYFLLIDSLDEQRKKWTKVISIVIISVYIVFILSQLSKCTEIISGSNILRHIFWLRILLLILFACECLSVIFFIERRKKINDAQSELKRPEALPKSIEKLLIVKLMQKLGFREDYIRAEMPLFRVFNLLGVVVLAIYLGGIFFIGISCNMGALAFVLLALGILIGIANLISGASIRIGVNLFLFLILLAVIVGNFYDPYPVRTTEASEAFSYQNRPTTEVYLQKWFEKRIKMMDSLPQFKDTAKTFDVYIALSNGGASRAGQWSSSVLGRIQDESYKKDSLNSFKDHLLCLSGASGGSVGNTAFYGLLKAQHDHKLKGDAYLESSSSFFHKDFLTFTIARMLARYDAAFAACLVY